MKRTGDGPKSVTRPLVALAVMLLVTAVAAACSSSSSSGGPTTKAPTTTGAFPDVSAILGAETTDPPLGRQITVVATDDLRPVMNDAKGIFTSTYPGTDVVVMFGSPDQAAKTAKTANQADAVLTTDPAVLSGLIETVDTVGAPRTLGTYQGKPLLAVATTKGTNTNGGIAFVELLSQPVGAKALQQGGVTTGG